ncbi:MAG: UDPGP type 1 family protein [Mariniblastus sp.]|nr:UDPGP type 1 family protein [Mariniblastus sp.]
MKSLEQLSSTLDSTGQAHLLNFWDSLSSSQQQQLHDQISGIDFEQLGSLLSQESAGGELSALADRAQPPPAITLEQFHDAQAHRHAVELGSDAIASGKVAMVLTAGGQGSRLGFEHPKGMYPIGPVSGCSLYQMIIEKVLARARQFGSSIPLYVMTSPPTHVESSNYLAEHDYFAYPADDFRLFCQGVMPAVDSENKIILAEKHSLFLSPDGHGGAVAALTNSGCLQEMLDRGVEFVFYGQVDNPLIQACDPALIGFHIARQSEMTTQVVRKTDPLQKVGNVVAIDGRVQIIEYSDLPAEYACRQNEDGSLRLWAGSIAVHVFDTAFLDRVSRDAASLPFHRARKKVTFVDRNGEKQIPVEPNATKFERFIFDLLPQARNAIVCEVDPAEGFCAVKNSAPAESETPQHVKDAISRLHRQWIRRAGVRAEDGVAVEISPLFAVDEPQFARRVQKMEPICEPTYLVDPGQDS